MFLPLAHTKLDFFAISKSFVLACYKETKSFPIEEKFGMISQIRRAALSVHLNIAEAASRKSEMERKRYYEISRGSLIEIDAALDIANDLKLLEKYDVSRLGECLLGCFKMLSGLLDCKTTR